MQFYKKREKVIILGTAYSLVNTPWDKEDYDYWACQPVLTHKDIIKDHRIDAVFEMHPPNTWKNFVDLLNDYIKVHNETVIFMQSSNTEIANCIKYPLEDLQNFVKHDKLKIYFTSTIAYMIALAIMYGYQKIEMYGVHMSADEEEYSMQRSCCEAWLNYGLGQGIDYWVPPEGDVMHSAYMYGYEQSKDVIIKIMQLKEGVQIGLKDLQKKEDAAKEERLLQEGGLMAMDKLIRVLKK